MLLCSQALFCPPSSILAGVGWGDWLFEALVLEFDLKMLQQIILPKEKLENTALEVLGKKFYLLKYTIYLQYDSLSPP